VTQIAIRQIPCLQDNYGYLLHVPEANLTATIDTPDPDAINAALDREGWQLTHILNTHWHADHAGGNLALKERWRCKVIGPKGEAAKIPGLDERVGDGDVVQLGPLSLQVFDVPGHTAGHIAYWIESENVLFVGDTIFALGCGRLFEGTPAQMWNSLSKLMGLPDETTVYCAHEYTQSNARFALTVEPGNKALTERAQEVDRLRAAGKPTVPSSLGLERRTNPFLRAKSTEIRRNLNLIAADDVTVFAEIRRRKDEFR
jgi:hydroxyacylglutathione hydrolase